MPRLGLLLAQVLHERCDHQGGDRDEDQEANGVHPVWGSDDEGHADRVDLDGSGRAKTAPGMLSGHRDYGTSADLDAILDGCVAYGPDLVEVEECDTFACVVDGPDPAFGLEAADG